MGVYRGADTKAECQRPSPMIRTEPFAILDKAFLYLVEVATFNHSAELLDDPIIRDHRPRNLQSRDGNIAVGRTERHFLQPDRFEARDLVATTSLNHASSFVSRFGVGLRRPH